MHSYWWLVQLPQFLLTLWRRPLSCFAKVSHEELQGARRRQHNPLANRIGSSEAHTHNHLPCRGRWRTLLHSSQWKQLAAAAGQEKQDSPYCILPIFSCVSILTNLYADRLDWVQGFSAHEKNCSYAAPDQTSHSAPYGKANIEQNSQYSLVKLLTLNTNLGKMLPSQDVFGEMAAAVMLQQSNLSMHCSPTFL